MTTEKDKQRADKTTKWMFGVLSFCAFATLLFGVLKISEQMILKTEPAGETASAGESLPSLEELMTKDSDNDGLSDFQELNMYGTSPYLADSDSDGYSDKEEIDGGFDPNCPKGEDCRGTGNGPVDSAKEQEEAIREGALSPLEDVGLLGGQLPADTLPTEQIGAQEIRRLMIDSGQLTPEQIEQLKQVDDATLLKIFAETAAEMDKANQ